MRGQRDKALVLRRVDVGESDRVVILYTRDNGKLPTVARGARNSSKRFAGSLEPFRLLEVETLARKHSDLSLLQSAETLLAFPRIIEDLDLVNTGWRLLELVDAFEQEEHANPELFDRLVVGLIEADEGQLDANVWRRRIEADLLHEAGFAPRFDQCAACGKGVGKLWFSVAEGGLICDDCRVTHPAESLPEGTAGSMIALFKGKDPFEVPEKVDQLLEDIIRWHLGKIPKTSKYKSEADGVEAALRRNP